MTEVVTAAAFGPGNRLWLTPWQTLWLDLAKSPRMDATLATSEVTRCLRSCTSPVVPIAIVMTKRPSRRSDEP